jgi:quercetin dioxygenase-like cupin family protein
MMHEYYESSNTWEVHPFGAEIVVCTNASPTVIQEIDGGTRSTTLDRGDAIIAPPGTWHAIDVEGPAMAQFVTAGTGTQVGPR